MPQGPDTAATEQAVAAPAKRRTLLQAYYRHRYLFILLAGALVWTIIFKYGPMYGVIIAFKKYRIFDGVWGSEWVGLANFVKLFNGTSEFGRVFRNTLLISLYRLFWGFPAPIILALLLNEVYQRHFKRVVQTISYLPHFLSWVVLGGVIRTMDTALKKEKEKYKECPVTPDVVPGHEVAQGWGFVVAGYFLVEQSFKAILYVRNKRICKTHDLLKLFNSFDHSDRETLENTTLTFELQLAGTQQTFRSRNFTAFLRTSTAIESVQRTLDLSTGGTSSLKKIEAARCRWSV